MKRLITTAMVLSLLGGVAAEAAGAGAGQDRLDRRGERGPSQDGGRGDGGGWRQQQPQQSQAQPQASGGDRGPRQDGGGRGGGWRQQQTQQSQPQAQPQASGGDRGDRGGWNGGGRPTPQAQQPQQTPPAPQAQAPRQGGDRGGWRQGQNGGRGNDGRGDEGRNNQGRNDQGRNDQGRGGWDRADQGRGGSDRGGWDRGSSGRPGQNGQWRERDRDRQRYDQRRYQPAYHASQRYRVGAYRYPRGFYARHWSFGDYLPGGWYGQSYYLDAWQYGLPYPPAGCEWVRVGNDALLVDVWSGQVLSVSYDLFW